MNRFISQWLCGVLLAGIVAAAGDPVPPVDAAWSLVRQLDFTGAAKALERGVAGPEGELAEAVVLMNAQPRTAANLAQARQRLQRVADGENAWREPALFLLARWHQYALGEPEPDAALAAYARLEREFPGGFWAELAASRVLLLQLFEAVDEDEARRILAGADARLAGLTDAGAKHELSLVAARYAQELLGDTTLAYWWSREQLAHLDVAAPRIQRGELLVRLALLAREQEDEAGERRFAAAFLELRPHDSRSFALAARLRELAASPSAAEGRGP